MQHEPEFSWFLPTSGDMESFGRPETQRAASLDYLVRVARAAEDSGFVSVLIPVGDGCEDAWVVGGMVAGWLCARDSSRRW
jgi:alkanesulfonate monooxygenase